jgi:thioredoxin-dependent peroxiredoxin
MLKPGDTAPEIDAITTRGERFVLSQQPGLCTVAYFFPKAFTPGCTKETKSFSHHHNELSLAGASLVGISTDDDRTQCRFAESMGLPFPLIADADKAISRAYDVLWPLVGVAQRVTYVIAGRLVLAAFRHELAVGKHSEDVVRFVDRIYRANRS